MLKHLYIKNYAIIDELKIDFSEQLNIITGETGAGKSIIINALGLILGNRADKSLVRDGASKCIVEATLLLKNSQQKIFKQFDLDFENETTIRKELNANGKSRIFINDTPSSIIAAKTISAAAIDFNSQHQKFALLENDYQLNTLDYFAKTIAEVEKYAQKFESYIHSKTKLKSLNGKLQKTKAELDFIAFQIEEFENANLSDANEEIELDKEHKRILNAEKLANDFQKINETLPALNEGFSDLISLVKNIAAFDDTFEDLAKRLESSGIEFEDISNEIEKNQSIENADPARLEFIENRLSVFHKLKSKHQAATLEELIAVKSNLENEVVAVDELENEVAALTKLVEAQYSEILKLADKLSQKRKKSAQKLENQLIANLKKVGIANSKVEYNFTKLNEPNETGIDELEICFTANEGFSAKPIKENVSGGELSRFMLAIKSILANVRENETIILDEIDAGISGEAAAMVANELDKLAAQQQIICITHLPQMASKGATHFYVKKATKNGKTFTEIKKLKPEERVNVIAELLGLNATGNKAIENAKALLEN